MTDLQSIKELKKDRKHPANVDPVLESVLLIPTVTVCTSPFSSHRLLLKSTPPEQEHVVPTTMLLPKSGGQWMCVTSLEGDFGRVGFGGLLMCC